MESYRIRKEIIDTTLQSITRNGIRAFRVEDLAHQLRISKKTIYRYFPTKTDLIRKCLEEINKTMQRKISFYILANEENPIILTLQFMKIYAEELYKPQNIFWEEFRHLRETRDLFYDNWQAWQKGGEKLLNACKNNGYICLNTNISLTIKRLLTVMFESRLDGETYLNQLSYYPILLRGISTDSGRSCLEQHISIMN